MKIDHIAIYVNDLDGVRDFFVRYFDATPGQRYRNDRTGFESYFMTFDSGARLEIMTRPDIDDIDKNHLRTGYAHLAISLGSRQAVDSLTARLSADGYMVISGPRTTGDGYYESCILGPENNLIELTI